ncbi:hypothetical protein WMY93_008558 [Mugilogobius chulae]|uniref:Fasciculation and elongation protein zeta-2-like n=1 Tax=Mugilogobius chulae TaxID=88201 RepID=A0AAW0PQB5_9GOBI
MAAPIAYFDEDWPSGAELSPLRGLVVPPKGHGGPAADAELLLEDELRDGSLSPADCGAFRSMEDLVKDFDEKLSACFQNYDAKTESIAPVNVLSEDTLLERDAIWTALTQSYSQVMPVDWKQSVTCSLHTPALNQEDQTRQTNDPVEVSDDEELREQLDMHSMIITSLTDEPLQTADQVIEEIEEMMQESPDTATKTPHSLTSPCSLWRSSASPAPTASRRFSMEGLSSVIQNSFRQTFRGGCSEKQYLTTVIPYATGHPPSIEDLQMLSKILLAMRDDSDKVPSLLTDYILKVVCPT